MYKLSILILFITCSYSLHGQWGVRAGFNINNTSSWDEYFSTVENRPQSVFESSVSFEVDYWTRLRNQRIEFYPYLSFHQATSELAVSRTSLTLRQIGGGVKTHIYLFDLIDDCDCPTFSKQGGLVKKGFFFLGGIGVDFAQKAVADEALRDGNIDVRGTIGIGLDIGLNDLVTISPFVAFNRYFDVSWHEIGNSFGQPGVDASSNINQLQIGVRIGFRPDYGNRRF